MGRWSFPVAIVMVCMFLSSCGGGGSGGAGDSSTPPSDGGDTRTPGANLGPGRGQALLGPIVSATASLYEAENFNGIPLCTVNTSALNSPDGPGVMDLSSCSTTPGKLYFIVVRGGTDIDADDNGFLDAAPTPKQGALRGLISGDDIARGNFRINILTEIAYQSVTDILLTGGTVLDIRDQLDNVANQLLDTDINSDEVIDNTDLIAFSPLLDANAVSGDNRELLEKILAAIHSGDRGELTNLSRQLLLASLGEFDFDGFSGPAQNFLVQDFLVEDGLLYAVGYDADSGDDDLRILIIDVQDFSDISLIGEVTLSARPVNGHLQIVKSGDFLYIASRGVGLIVADVTNPAAPDAAVRIPEEDIFGVEAGGDDNLYISFMDLHDLSIPQALSYVSVYDITDPDSPLLQSTESNLIAFTMVYADGRLYTTGSGFNIFDASSPSSLTLISSDTSIGGAGEFVYSDGFIYVPANDFGANGIKVFDVTDPADIQEVQTLSGSGLISSIAIRDNLIFVGENLEHGSSAVTTFEISETGTLGLLDSRSAPMNFNLDIDDNRVYLSGSTGFVAYPVAALKNRSNYLNFIETPRTASHVEVIGNTAYVADGNHLITVDVSTPEGGLTILDQIPVGNNVSDMKISGNYAYLASEGLYRVDISNPDNLEIEGINMDLNPIPGGGTAVTATVAVGGEYAYTQTGNKLGKFSIAEPGDPVLVVNNEVSAIYKDLAVKENHIYGVNGQILEVFNANTLAFTNQIPLLANTIEVAGDYAYTSSSTSGISILNVMNSSSPALFGGRLSLGIGNAVSVSGNTAYVANEFGMIEVYDVSNKTSPELLYIKKVNGTVRDIFVTENYIYAVNGFGLIIEPVLGPLNSLE